MDGASSLKEGDAEIYILKKPAFYNLPAGTTKVGCKKTTKKTGWLSIRKQALKSNCYKLVEKLTRQIGSKVHFV